MTDFVTHAKLYLAAYGDRDAKATDWKGGMEVAYNPNSIDLGYTTEYAANSFLNGGGINYRFKRALPGTLNIELVFDAILPGNDEPVDEQIEKLRALCQGLNPKTQESWYLRVSWGKLQWHGQGYFVGRMTDMRIQYTMFKPSGKPLRASVFLTIEGDPELMQAKQGKMPTMMAVDFFDMAALDALAFKLLLVDSAIDGGIALLELALENDMDSLDDLLPGDLLVGPAQ